MEINLSTMTKYLTPEEYKQALEKYRGAYAQLWLFSVSRKRFVIRLSFKGEMEELFIICVGCEHISGSFHWDNANISIMEEGALSKDLNESNTRVFDVQAKFELFCNGGIAMIISSDADTFKNFF